MDTVKEISCGTAAGFIGKFVDYPFDTVKTRIQMRNSPYKGTLDCILKTAKTEGFWGFYGGIMSPCVGAAFENAAAFTMYGRARHVLMNNFVPAEQRGKNHERPLWVVSAAGAFSGIGTGSVLTPVELIKSRVQTNPDKYPSVPSAVKTIFKEEGPAAFMKGYSATLAREIPGNAAWFLTYELALRNLFIPTGKTRADAPWYAFPISGGIGGIFYWGLFYPADTVKTRMQTDESYAKKGLIRGMRSLYREGGIPALYLGFEITMMRAVPANATIFGVYEAADKTWQKAFGESDD